MVIDIKMSRSEPVPWGFRLVGGSDFEYPLTVVKVTEGSIAEEAGLKVGDVIVRINDTAASPLTHEETNRLIKQCDKVFYLGVQRELVEEDPTDNHFSVVEVESRATPESFREARSPCRTPDTIEASTNGCEVDYQPELEDRPDSVLSENTEQKLVENEIAAVLSGELEVLKEHNVMGIFPKSGVCMTSDVLRSLNEEATKTRAEKDKENKKWTTFLQKPNRPIPKSKAQVEAERRAANAYKMTIVKSAPKIPERTVSPAVLIKAPEPETQVEPQPVEEYGQSKSEPEEEAPTPADTEVPNLEQEAHEALVSEEQQEKELEETKREELEVVSSEIDETGKEGNSTEGEIEEAAAKAKGDLESESVGVVLPEKSEEELALERQLADVQKQLAALSSLPTTIQATLDAVTKQLAQLLPTFRLQQQLQQQQQSLQDHGGLPQAAAQNEIREISLEKIDEVPQQEENDANEPCEEQSAINSEAAQQQSVEAVDNDMDDDNNQDDKMGEQQQQQQQQLPNFTDETNDAIDENSIKRPEAEVVQSHEELRQLEEQQKLKKQKRQDVIGELAEHLERKNNPKHSKRAFGPLTPSSERPLVLPGGRRWYRPKDAFNDEFIAETLSAQAELITGTTLGVNFMKYQKPEKKIDLNRSEVYKVIHHLDRQPVRGIEVRPSVVHAEADIRRTVHS